MAKGKRVTVVRHSKLFIALHWLIVVEMLLLLLTGFSVSEGFKPGPIPRGTARALHLVVGLAWLATITFFVYYFVVSGEYRWFGLSRIGYGFDFLVEETGASCGDSRCTARSDTLQIRVNTSKRLYPLKC